MYDPVMAASEACQNVTGDNVRKGLQELKNLADSVTPFQLNDHRPMQFEVYKDDEFVLSGWYFPYKPEDQRNFHKFTQPLIQQGYEITQWKEAWRNKS